MYRLQTAYVICWVLLTCAFGAMVAVRFRQASTDRSESYGRFNQQQIVDRTEPLCRAIAPECAGLAMKTERVITPRPGRDNQRTWTVDCFSHGHEYIAGFIWNADTGDLWQVGCVHERSPSGMFDIMSRQQAIRESWRLMEKLGFAGKSVRWRAGEDTCRDTTAWTVYWRGGDLAVWIKMDSRSGDLLFARSWREAKAEVVPQPGAGNL